MTQMVLAPAIVTTATVTPFAAELAAQLAQNDAVELDVTEVADADVSFLQLICAARHQAERDGKALRLTRPASGPVAALLERAGFLTDIAPADQMFWFHGDLPQ
jgi:ABC-type transporter Mla MlaB component